MSAYMSVVVHLCLHRLKQSQSPNWIRAYGKVGEGRVGRRRREGGLDSCLSLFWIPASPGGTKQSELRVRSWILLQSASCRVLRSIVHCRGVVPGNLNPGVDELGAMPVCRALGQSVLNCEV